MTLHWSSLLPAILLLWFPMLARPKVPREMEELVRWAPANPLTMMQLWLNWVDLARASLGTWLLLETAFEFDADDRTASRTALLLRAGILVVGLLLQTIRFRHVLYFVAPAFYLSGITLLLGRGTAGGFAVFVSWAFALALRNGQFVLPVMALALALSTCVLGDPGLSLFLNVALLITPLLLGVLFLRGPRLLDSAGIFS
jgi:hypothetical protein